jgi:tubulin gamma
LLQTKNVMVSTDPRNGVFTSILNIIQGDVDPSEVHKALMKIRERKDEIKFIPWGPASLQVALAKKSPYVEAPHKVSGMMLANNTCVRVLFNRAVDEFERLRSRGAFLNQYKSTEGFELAEFDDSKEVVLRLAEEYEACERPDYLNWAGLQGKRDILASRAPLDDEEDDRAPRAFPLSATTPRSIGGDYRM